MHSVDPTTGFAFLHPPTSMDLVRQILDRME
jgi:hypothetical protein